MKRVWWIVRIAVIVAASYCIFAPAGSYTLPDIQAQSAGCDTTRNCGRNSENSCYCTVSTLGGPGCNGCFVTNGSTECGKCSAGPAELND
jgi:hypothetical protein